MYVPEQALSKADDGAALEVEPYREGSELGWELFHAAVDEEPAVVAHRWKHQHTAPLDHHLALHVYDSLGVHK